MNIQEFRTKYPQYDDLDDTVLADKLYNKYYTDLPKEEFLTKFGVKPAPAPAPAPEERGNFMRGVTNIPGQFQDILGSAKVFAGNLAYERGNRELGTELIESGLASSKEGKGKVVSKPTDEFTTAWNNGIGDVLTKWLPYNAGAGIGNAAEALAFAGAGWLTGKGAGVVRNLLSRELVKEGAEAAAHRILQAEGREAAENYVKSAAAKVLANRGAQLGTAAQAAIHGAGEVTGRALEEKADPYQLELARVAPAAIVHAVSDFVVNRITLGAMNVGEAPAKGLISEVSKRIAMTGIKELPGEEIQTIAERYGANMSLADANALRDYVNTAMATAAMSVGPGAVGGVRNYMAGPKTNKVEDLYEEEQPEPSFQMAPTETAPAATPAPAAPAATPTSAPATEADINAELALAAQEGREEKVSPSVDAITQAANYVARVDSGEVKPSPPVLGAMLKKLGIKRPPKVEGVSFRDQALELIREFVNKPAPPQGEQNVGSGEAVVGGTEPSVAVSSVPGSGVAGVPAPAGPAGVATDTANRPQFGLGTSEQQPALTQHFLAQPLGDRIATLRQHQALFGKDQPPPTWLGQVLKDIDLQNTSPIQKAALAFINKYYEVNNRPPSFSEVEEELARQGFEAPTTPIASKPPQKTVTEAPAPAPAAVTPEAPVAETPETEEIPDYPQGTNGKLKKFPKGNKPVTVTGEAGSRTFPLPKRHKVAQRGIITPSMRQGYESMRKEFDLPAWEKGDLTQDDKDVYFSHITRGPTIEAEHRAAAEALSRYRARRVQSRQTLSGKERRIAVGYDEDREIQSKIHQMDFPNWDRLSADAKHIYFAAIKNNSARQRDEGFAAVAAQLEKEGTHVRGLTGRRAEELRQKATEKEAHERAQAEIKAAQDKQEKDTKTDLALFDVEGKVLYSRVIRGLPISETAEKALQKGNIVAALKAIAGTVDTVRLSGDWTKDTPKVLQYVANALVQKKIFDGDKVQVVTDPNSLIIKRLQHFGRLGAYSAKTNTIYITPEGMFSDVVLHELIHAATANALYQYETNPASLPQAQREAIEHLHKIYEYAKKELGGKYKSRQNNPYENVHEFLTHALTDSRIRYDLSVTKAPALAKYSKGAKELWTQLTQMFGRFIELFTEKRVSTGGYEIKPGIFAGPHEGNLMVEVSEIFSHIMSPAETTTPIDMLYATSPGTQARQAPLSPRVESLDSLSPGYQIDPKDKPRTMRYIFDRFATRAGWKKTAYELQNSRYYAKSWQHHLDMGNKITYGGPDATNIYTQLTLAPGRARTLYNNSFAHDYEVLNKNLATLAKNAKLSIDGVLTRMHAVLEALHWKERSWLKYLFEVPLNEAAATRRMAILDELNKPIEIPNDRIVMLRRELEDLVEHNRDAYGYSPRFSRAAGRETAPIDFPGKRANQEVYNATGMSQASVEQILEQYTRSPQHKDMEAIVKTIQRIHENTKKLNSKANYWSIPVDNRVRFYGFENYVPLKGVVKHSAIDELLDLDSAKNGKELQEAIYSMEGRVSVSKNPILQTMSDAIRSTIRAGQGDLTLTIRNAAKKDNNNPNGQNLLDATVVKHLTFMDRQDPNVVKSLPREGTIFVYNKDGSMDIIKIHDQQALESIRRTWKASNPLLDMMNSITSTLGQMHTRYNYQFAPMNFIRDSFTNAFVMGADFGPAKAAKFGSEMAGVFAENGMYKALRFAMVYEKGSPSSKAALARMRNDPFVRDMIEFVEEGGMVSYIQGLSLKSNFQQLQREIGRNGIIKTKEQFDKFVDVWTDMFELTGRVAAYRVVKTQFLAEGRKRGLTGRELETFAKIRAVEYAKNLANFEQVGHIGKQLGAAFMFFRPAATGAVRAIESLMPAFDFRSWENVKNTLPATLRDDASALKAYREKWEAQKTNSRSMAFLLCAAGYGIYLMSRMMAPDDELGRNLVEVDNPQQWTRYMRFFIPGFGEKGKEFAFQIPWGFGFGAFGAIGAQVGAYIHGRSSFSDMLLNIGTQIALDSFVPLPVSRIPPQDDPLAFVIDSVTPSAFRPLVEFAINKNGIGQAINSASTRRVGDAYTGGDKIPEIYKDLAKYMVRQGGFFDAGDIDIAPNSLYFFANSYLDGLSRIAETGYGMQNLAADRTEFNPKTDLMLLNSFVGTRSSVDAREFAKVEGKIKDIEKKVNQFKKADPEQLANYVVNNPTHMAVVDLYNKSYNNQLKHLNEQANNVKVMPLDPKDRDALLKAIRLQQNLVKYQLVQMFDAYDIKP